MLKSTDTHCIRHVQGYAEQKLRLSQVLGGELMHDLVHRAGFAEHAIAELRLLINEYAFPRNQHILENGDAVHLVKTGRERVILDTAAERGDGRTADETQPLGR